ncbi:helix-turn-helix transcriptional regulator [Pseudomonas sp. CCI2.4]|uniref:helix-turn-helix domain-containing protein n=1 Tax=Pseudomonas sp. CCI2.4 TaxID=3048617 RepID=UPI002B23C0C1|nr:helix-turn-helix transcriptional regulator [Pseudomonas sp. CCI2.4]MEB0133452.1 helix-turn-helix transcriptional regulator [Pseudomonas sp. CCI2.4]
MSATDLPNKLDALLGSGWTYKAVAERAKCDISTIFRIRNGQINNPSYIAGRAIDAMHAELAKQAKSCAKKSVA